MPPLRSACPQPHRQPRFDPKTLGRDQKTTVSNAQALTRPGFGCRRLGGRQAKLNQRPPSSWDGVRSGRSGTAASCSTRSTRPERELARPDKAPQGPAGPGQTKEAPTAPGLLPNGRARLSRPRLHVPFESVEGDGGDRLRSLALGAAARYLPPAASPGFLAHATAMNLRSGVDPPAGLNPRAPVAAATRITSSLSPLAPRLSRALAPGYRARGRRVPRPSVIRPPPPLGPVTAGKGHLAPTRAAWVRPLGHGVSRRHSGICSRAATGGGDRSAWGGAAPRPARRGRGSGGTSSRVFR